MVTDQNKNRCHKDFISTRQTWLALPTTEITIAVFIIWKKVAENAEKNSRSL